jgi:hypothetical protein
LTTIPKILRVVWGKQNGYVCLSTRKVDAQGHINFKDHLFKWPEERDNIPDLINTYKEDHDIYWAPMVFSQRRRKSEFSTDCPYLWADLDPRSPHSCLTEPSIAWESSPGRYQAIWLLDQAINPVDHDELNKRMTYAEKADKSGWDLTQVLRLPDTTNHKYVEKPTVKLMWLKKTYYEPNELAETLPATDLNPLIEINDLDIEFNDLKEMVWPYRHILGDKLWTLLFTPDSQVKEGDRSDRLWELESRLIESGVPVVEVIKIAKASPWNKYRGRPDEDKRILLEVLKVESNVKTSPIVIPGTNDKMGWVNYSKFLGQRMVGPGWLIENIWANNSHGMIAGEPKTYKSIISTEIAVSVASGYPMWDRFKVMRTGAVLLIQEENAPWVVQDRLIKVAHSKDLLRGSVKQVENKSGKLFITFPKELPIKILNNWGFDLTTTEHRLMLERMIAKIKPALLILDPLYLMLGRLDDNSAQDLRETLNWMLKLKTEYGLSIIILHHWNKGGASGRGGQRMLGSTTFHAWVESAMYTSIRDVETNYVTIEREFRSFMKPDVLTMGVKMSEPGEEPDYQVVLNKTKELVKKGDHESLLDLLAVHGTLTSKELETAGGGYSSPGMKKVMKALATKGYVKEVSGKRGRGGPTVYTITDEGRKHLKEEEEVKENEQSGI